MTFDIIMHGVAINFHTNANAASCHVVVVVVKLPHMSERITELKRRFLALFTLAEDMNFIFLFVF